MTIASQTQHSISEAVLAYKINRNTLNSWVRNGKIRSQKVSRGKREFILVDVASLEAHLAARDSTKNPVPAEISKTPEVQEAMIETEVESTTDADGGETNPPTSQKKGRKKPRVKPPRQLAKNLMRSFSSADLLNVQSWIIQRLEARLGEADAPSGA